MTTNRSSTRFARRAGRSLLWAATALTLCLMQQPGRAQAEALTIMAGDLPPMFNADGSGREADVIRNVLERCGHSVTFKIQPYTRHWSSYGEGQGDAVATVPVGMPLDGQQTGAYVQYQNGVTALASAAGKFGDLDLLKGHSVVGFLGASDILPGLAEASGEFKSYKEVADQLGQSRLMYGHRVDAVIGDGMIFAEYARQLREGGKDLPFDATQEITFQAVFAPSEFAMNFRAPEIAADFDRCYGEAQADGTVARINKEWADRYRETLGTQYLGY